jgi:hypothetical protein
MLKAGSVYTTISMQSWYTKIIISDFIESTTEFSQQQNTLTEFSTLDVTACMPCTYRAVYQYGLT